MELTHNNYFRTFYSNNDQWSVEYSACSRKPMNFGDECLKTARLLAAAADQDIFVLFSGGIDSEVVARSFKQAALEFRVAILRFTKSYNQHDIAYAEATCEQLNIKPLYLDLDIDHFFNSGHAHNYAKLTNCYSWQLLATMWTMEHVPGYPVLGSGEPFLIRSRSRHIDWGYSKYRFLTEPDVHDPWELWEKEKISSWYRFLAHTNKPGCAGFFQYTPEIMLAFLQDDISRSYWQNPYNLTSTDLKQPLYGKYFPLRARPKYTGYERLDHLANKYQAKFAEEFAAHNQVVSIPLNKLVYLLKPKEFYQHSTLQNERTTYATN